jgi:probable selenium-dependent hydroxylase accessory protein YqeC
MTTTTRVGVEEFRGVAVRLVSDAADMDKATRERERIILIAGGMLEEEKKYRGVDPSLIDGQEIPSDVVVLVECDGSRRRPLKVPTDREPVIPASACAVFALMGATGFDEPITEEICYNHEAALSILGGGLQRFDAEAIAAVASHPQGSFKGVLPGVRFHVIFNQGDIAVKRPVGVQALALLSARGINASMLSWRKETLYETTPR